MKISKPHARQFFFIAGCTAIGLTVSCGSTNVATPEPQPIVEPAPVVEESEPLPVVEEPKIEEPKEEPKVEEPSPVAEEPVVEPQEVPAPSDDEYTRSVGAVAVDRDTFTDDKQKVLAIISELDTIMKNMDYKSWVPYVETESVNYWKLRKNLQKYEKRLPVKGIKLKELQDYFKHVFVPARKGREVSEIRYISDTYIKAVQVREDQEDLIYYYFNKIDGKWKVHLPTNEELN